MVLVTGPLSKLLGGFMKTTPKRHT